jgi:anti-sigma regulatory factor (Ser/Thr protein kinase)
METILSSASRQALYEVSESTQIAAARRAGSDLARRLGFDETAAGKVAIVITEAATNMVKHAERGEILIRPLQCGDVPGIEVLAIDSGPGMANVALNMQDGMSTSGTYGVGLGAMHRLADELDIYTAPDKGTVLCMTMWARPDVTSDQALRTGVVCLPIAGETVCGDAWVVSSDQTVSTVLVADGLGHGPDAATAAEAATEVVARRPDFPPRATLQEAHAALRGTRGAAVAAAYLDAVAEQMHFAGIGNIAAYVFSGGQRRQMVSHNGIVGSNMRTAQEFAVPWTAGSMLIMHSDGLGTRWDMAQYPGLPTRHPSVIAAVLYRDFSRRRDDVTVLVIREHQGD